MILWLITHSEELKKKSGTGKLVAEVLKEKCKIIEWKRTQPSSEILDLAPKDTIIVYPSTEHSYSIEQGEISSKNNIIILDGTWQQARKIYNRSEYLKKFPNYEIIGLSSLYSKRRNQTNNGLCTAEVAIHLLETVKDVNSAALEKAFHEFNLSP